MKTDRILAPVDFSDASKIALREAVALAQEKHAELVVFHVHPIVRAVFLEATFTESAEASAEYLTEAEKALEALVADVAGDYEQLVIKATVGDPTVAIIDASKNFDLIVMSSHGHTGLSELLLGSVTERVVRGAKCSVLVVKES